MRKQDNETYEAWLDRVHAFELDYAKKQLAQGEDINLVLEAMSARIMKKALHPILIAIRENSAGEFDAVESRKRYLEQMKTHKPVADHIEGQIFDKD